MPRKTTLVAEYGPLISAIRIEKLFGQYTYRMPEQGVFSNAAILYGDNGVGKSTILRLAFHLLSAANNKGHRSALYEAKFENLEVDLASGVTLKAIHIKTKEAPSTLRLSIWRGAEVLATWDYIPGRKDPNDETLQWFTQVSERGEHVIVRRPPKKTSGGAPQGEQIYLKTLNTYAPTMFILNADRRLDSDAVSDPSDELELRRVMKYEEPKRINDLAIRSREIALSQAINAAEAWIRNQAFQGANQASMNVHSVYVNVLHHLVSPSPVPSDEAEAGDVSGLIRRVGEIEARTKDLAKYEIATTLSTSDFRKALQARSKNKRQLAAELLTPYVTSLESRLAAVEPTYHIVDKFIQVLGGFLSDKTVSFKVSEGFRIKNKLGEPLKPAQLSSGEQQLMLLFCYVLTGREKSSVFMIDEPEISLNIKWQRKLVQSLLDITEHSNTQFIFASHSMEFLAQHRNLVTRVVNA
jgi:predicted ATPase